MDPIEGVILLKKDFNDEDAPQALIDALGGHKADLVMSDMAAPTTGHRATDHICIMQLVELAADFAVSVLAPGGAFVTKVFQGGTEHELLRMLQRDILPPPSTPSPRPAAPERGRDLSRWPTGFKGWSLAGRLLGRLLLRGVASACSRSLRHAR